MWEKRINLIFDLDETLVQLGKENFNDRGIHIKRDKYLFIRPGCQELLDFCFKNYQVSFWTSGSPRYCHKILSILLTAKQIKKTKIIICKYKKQFLELKTSKLYQSIKYYLDDEVVSHYVKSLNLLWNIEDFNKTFSLYNTLIIDDNFFLEKINPSNYIKITPWCRYMEDDDSLIRLNVWLRDNKKILNTLRKKKKKLLLLTLVNNFELSDCLKNRLNSEDIASIEGGNGYRCREDLITEI